MKIYSKFGVFKISPLEMSEGGRSPAPWKFSNLTCMTDYTRVANQLRTVSWSYYCHPMRVFKPVYMIPTFPLTEKLCNQKDTHLSISLCVLVEVTMSSFMPLIRAPLWKMRDFYSNLFVCLNLQMNL